MPRNKKEISLGKSLIRAHKKKSNFVIKDGYRHTSDLPDGRDFGRLNLNSVTEQTSLDYFLDTAALAQNDYASEFSDIKIVEKDVSNGILSESEKTLVALAQDKNKEILCIPRRPLWDSNTSKEELDTLEKESFLIWRRKLALSQEHEHINLTPYEKNLEVWRQLWRVIERSDVVVQILDARNPLLFRCPDLEVYVKETDERKTNVLLLNKADFLTEHERQCWCDYFNEVGIHIAFFSALEEMNRSEDEDDSDAVKLHEEAKDIDFSIINNIPKILSREDLIMFLKGVPQYRSSENVTAIGLVGYPNVGKSSTINAILMSKKVSVSATPGKTKHFQTFIIEEDLCLCDCPGLVFPNFVSTKAEMVINGILPIDQLTNWIQPVTLVTSFIPRNVLEATYSILIPAPGEGRDAKSPPTAEEFLNAHGYNRGFMTQRGLPDNARSSRYVLKDFVNGKLLYCHAPPGIKQEDFHQFPDIKNKRALPVVSEEDVNMSEKMKELTEADKRFFAKAHGVHMKGRPTGVPLEPEGPGKPWRKHNNRNKKEKLRRIYRNPYEC